MKRLNVCVCGLGRVGVPSALYIRGKGFKVYGYDIEARKIEGIETFTNFNEVPKCDVYVITVNTRSVSDICEKISEKEHGALICVESTVPVGTCRKVAKTCKFKKLAHVPHRYWAYNPEEFGIRQIRVIGALNELSLEEAILFYEALEIPLFKVSSLETAELVKLAENTARYLQISFAEELKLYCEKLNINFGEVRNAINTRLTSEILDARWNMPILEAEFSFCLVI